GNAGMTGKIGVRQLRLPLARQTVSDRQHQPSPRFCMLEEAVAIGEQTVCRAHLDLAGMAYIPGKQTVEVVVLLDPIGTNILYGGRTGRAGNESQVLKAVPALVDAGRHELMPGLARLYFYDEGVRVFVDKCH